MRRITMGWMLTLAIALAVPTFGKAAWAAGTKSAKSSDEAASAGDKNLSKEEQARLREHNKLRSEIMKIKYPASKADVVAHVKGIKPDDKKWFEDTLPDKTFESSDDVMSALGWETAPAAEKGSAPAKSKKTQK